MTSVAVTEAGNPLLEIQQADKDKFVAKISSFAYFNTVLHLAGSAKIKELQMALQGKHSYAGLGAKPL